MGVQEVLWDKEGTARAGVILSSIEKETNVINWEQDFVHHRILLAGKRVEFVNGGMSYTV